jgi:hypothetical protein
VNRRALIRRRRGGDVADCGARDHKHRGHRF